MDTIKVSKLREGAKLPTRKNPTDAGMDLYSSNVDFYLGPLGIQVVNTGVTLELPVGCVGLVWPKSRSNFLIGGGVIDQDYQGEILVKIMNVSNSPLLIKEGDAIAQLLIQPVKTPEIVEASLDEIHKVKTARGNTGGIVTELSSLPVWTGADSNGADYKEDDYDYTQDDLNFDAYRESRM